MFLHCLLRKLFSCEAALAATHPVNVVLSLVVVVVVVVVVTL